MGTSLVIGTRSLCAASFSAWLVLRRAGLRCDEIVVPLRQRDTAKRLRELSPTGSVPTLLLDGVPITGPMGIADHAAWRLPSLWPDPEHRDLARRSALAAVNGLAELAAFLPMDMTARFAAPGPLIRPVAEGLAKLTAIWDECREASGGKGSFLFGRFGVVDAMMAPWVARLVTHAVPLERRHAAYADALRALPEWAEWEAAISLAAAAALPAPAEPRPTAKPAAAAAGPGTAAQPAAAPVVEEPALPPPEPIVTTPVPPPWNRHRPIRRPGFVEPPPPTPVPRRRPIRPAVAPPPGHAVDRSTRARAAVALVAVALIGTAAVLALPQALATIELVAPYLRDVVRQRPPVQPAASRPEEPLPMALSAPEPTEAETALHPRVVVHYSGSGREAEAAQRLARQLEEKGYVVVLRPVDIRIARPSVRYYFADDRAATVELAASVEQSLDGETNPRVLDLSHQRSKPKPGTLEVWIGPTRS